MKKKKKKKHLTTILLLVVFLVGLSVLVYPTFSNFWNSLHQTRAVADYRKQVSQISGDDYTAILDAAQAYNAQLADDPNRFMLTPDEVTRYESLLNFNESGVMGIVTIPKINVDLPIYHGTDDTVLQAGVGHYEGSSLPVGGSGTHAVLSGHTGLPSAELFTRIDKLEIGDRFQITVLDEMLTYEVDQINVVEPDDMSKLGIEPGQDCVTLVTCTPYGINTQRLLVRGHRVENGAPKLNVRVEADAVQVSLSLEALIGILLMAAAVLAYVLSRYRKNRTRS